MSVVVVVVGGGDGFDLSLFLERRRLKWEGKFGV